MLPCARSRATSVRSGCCGRSTRRPAGSHISPDWRSSSNSENLARSHPVLVMVGLNAADGTTARIARWRWMSPGFHLFFTAVLLSRWVPLGSLDARIKEGFMSSHHKPSSAALIVAVSMLTSCSEKTTPVTPTDAESRGHHASGAYAVPEHGDKGYIDGWIDGEDVQLYYTKSYF